MSDNSSIVIVNKDGSRETKNKHLRLIKLPPVDFQKDEKTRDPINDEIEEQIKSVFEMFSYTDDTADPIEITEALRSVGFHLQCPDVFRVLEDFNLEQKEHKRERVSFPRFMNYINAKLADYKSWANCGKVFHNVKDKVLFEKEKKNEVTKESLLGLMKEIGIKELNLQDIDYILNLVSDGQDPNITQDEFYFLMTKKPTEYDALANITKKFKDDQIKS